MYWIFCFSYLFQKKWVKSHAQEVLCMSASYVNGYFRQDVDFFSPHDKSFLYIMCKSSRIVVKLFSLVDIIVFFSHFIDSSYSREIFNPIGTLIFLFKKIYFLYKLFVYSETDIKDSMTNNGPKFDVSQTTWSLD